MTPTKTDHLFRSENEILGPLNIGLPSNGKTVDKYLQDNKVLVKFHIIRWCMLTMDQILTAPLDYLRESPGKDIRGGLTNAFNQFLCLPEAKVNVIKRIIDLLHNASLL
jgi:hypothetical protein